MTGVSKGSALELRPATDEDVPAITDDHWEPFAEEMAGIDLFDELVEGSVRRLGRTARDSVSGRTWACG